MSVAASRRITTCPLCGGDLNVVASPHCPPGSAASSVHCPGWVKCRACRITINPKLDVKIVAHPVKVRP